MNDHRLRSWIDWYRFARQRLDYAHEEAVVYANVRAVEELNRQGRSADGPASILSIDQEGG